MLEDDRFNSPEFIARLKAGDDEAWRELIEGVQGDLLAGIIKLLWGRPNRRDEAKDLLQKTFESGFRYITKFRCDSQIQTWLYTIAVNKTRTHLKSIKKGPKIVITDSDDSEGWTNLRNPALNPEDELRRKKLEELRKSWNKEIEDLTKTWKSTLSPENRRLWELHEDEGWTAKEIANLLGVSEGTVSSRLSRMGQKRREFLVLELLGIAVEELSDQLKINLSVPEGLDGVFVKVIRLGSPTMKAGIRDGDIIERIGNELVDSVQLFTKIMEMIFTKIMEMSQVDRSRDVRLTVARGPEWKKFTVLFTGRNGKGRV